MRHLTLQLFLLFFTNFLLSDIMEPSSSPKTSNYGTWDSPISAESIAQGSSSKLNMLIDEGNTYFVELRPQNKGKYTIVKRDQKGTLQDVTPSDFNVRTFVHEYGGGAFTVHKGIIYASSGADSAIYIIEPGKEPVKLTKGQTKTTDQGQTKVEGTRFADMHVTSKGIVAVGELHEAEKPVENFLALIDLKTGEYKKIATGYDFYSSPAISHNEKQIAWISWNHPNMPWTDTELWLADIDDQGMLKNQKRIAGDIPESIFQPQWSPDNVLHFVTDRDKGWWNIHRYHQGVIENVFPIEAEVGEPLWVFQRATYAFLGDRIIFTYNKDGLWHLGLIDPKKKQWRSLGNLGVYIQQVRSGKNFVQFLESYADKGDALIQIDDTPDTPMHILMSTEQTVDPAYISNGQHIAFPSGNRTAYGFYYPPKNKDFKGTENQRPPLVVMVHGGPISQARNALQLKHQYWTSRGFAILDVNYGGSTGYGRAYRNLLNYNWGVVDVEDCINGAKFLASKNLADPNKLVIRGGSAGGFTTLAALTKGETFKGGANYYGVADITALAQDTHKFEKHDMEQLVGKYPEEKDLWMSRSPLNSVNKITSPLIIFQGEDDRIVPKNQSVMIYEALKKKGVPTEIHIYPGEEHGFRQAANIIHSLKRESEFYLEIFGLTPSQKADN
jgi:dipeptidyl aminopeptidase/acylaminoacyl peptidase